MDKNVVLAVFLLFLIVVDASNAKFRKLAADHLEKNPTSNQVLGENKPDPRPIGAPTERGNDQVQNNPSQLGPKPDVVSSPPRNGKTDNIENLNSTNLGSLPPLQNQILNDEKSLKGLKNTEDGKNLKNSSSADLTISNPDRGKVPKRVNGMDLLSPPLAKEKDNGKSGGDERDNGKTPKHVNGTDLLSPPPAKEKDNGKSGDKERDNGKTPKPVNGTDLPSPPLAKEKDNGKSGDNKVDNGKTPKHVNGTDLPSPSPGNEKDNGKSGGSETDKGKTPKHVNGTDLLSPSPVDEKYNGKNSGNEKDNGKNGENKNDNGKSGGNETDNGKNGRIEENTTDDISSSPVKEADNGKDGGIKDKGIDKTSSSELGIKETCDGLPKCTDLRALTACIQNFDTRSGEFTVLVQNDGEKTLRVNLTDLTDVENPLKPLELSKHQPLKINISVSGVKNNKLILNAGNGECVLHTDHPESENVFVYLPSYDKLVTPINGAYFLILSVLVFGGTWACCRFRKRRWQGGVPYQELEMGLPESVSATNVETAEGWDQGWDDDWDEDNAVKSPATRMGSISANGLTSRSPNRDGWEQDWDD